MLLERDNRLEQPDSFYAGLIAAHDGLSLEQSADLNFRLLLILANQIGRHDVLQAAIAAAREGVTA
ncbi:DUF2783 domain-containing protein [Parapedomonas caeni]